MSVTDDPTKGLGGGEVFVASCVMVPLIWLVVFISLYNSFGVKARPPSADISFPLFCHFY